MAISDLKKRGRIKRRNYRDEQRKKEQVPYCVESSRERSIVSVVWLFVNSTFSLSNPDKISYPKVKFIT